MEDRTITNLGSVPDPPVTTTITAWQEITQLVHPQVIDIAVAPPPTLLVASPTAQTTVADVPKEGEYRDCLKTTVDNGCISYPLGGLYAQKCHA